MLTDDPPIRIFPENLYLKEYNLKLLTPETMELLDKIKNDKIR